MRGRSHINLLDFITQVICIWVDILENKISKHDCFLGMGDRTSAMGWLCRSNFWERDESDKDWLAKQKLARKLAHLILDSETLLYKQWFRGKDNVVADSLSCDVYFVTCSWNLFKIYCLSSVTSQFSHSSSTGRDLLIHLIDSVAIACQSTIVFATKGKQSGLWQLWLSFLNRTGFEESNFLRGLSIFQQNILFSAFAQAIREGTLTRRNKDNLVEGTICKPRLALRP